MIERLTKRTENGGVKFSNGEYWNTVYPQNENCLTDIHRMAIKLCELEDKIEQGTLIELPCKVGDTVYRITKSYRAAEQVTPYIVKEIIIDKKGVSYLTIALKGTQSITCKVKLETVFLTREEAEKRLKELQ
jgi:hypothetical protein